MSPHLPAASNAKGCSLTHRAGLWPLCQARPCPRAGQKCRALQAGQLAGSGQAHGVPTVLMPLAPVVSSDKLCLCRKLKFRGKSKKKPIIYSRNTVPNVSHSPSPPSQQSPILRTRVRGGVLFSGTCCKHRHNTNVFSMNSICPTCTALSHSQMCLCHTETRLNERDVAL